MCQLIDNIANDKGINVEDANYIYKFISGHLSSKIPALGQVIQDVFENADEGVLQEHVNKAIQLIQQQQWKEKFKDYIMPPQTYFRHRSGGRGTELY